MSTSNVQDSQGTTGQNHTPVLFLDIDNCLYSPNIGIHDMMFERIVAFGLKHGMSDENVKMLCRKYYKDYGVAIKGMVIHDEINPTTFDEEVDQTLPLEYVIKEDPELQSMLKQVNARIWAFTNANYPHASRVLKLLGIFDLIHGITYCDYTNKEIICKPDIEAYEKALKDSGTHPGTKCYLVDDSTRNIITAKEMGWVGIHCWPGESEVGDYHIEKIHDLFKVVPELQRSN